jgi:hypothetical protein
MITVNSRIYPTYTEILLFVGCTISIYLELVNQNIGMGMGLEGTKAVSETWVASDVGRSDIKTQERNYSKERPIQDEVSDWR